MKNWDDLSDFEVSKAVAQITIGGRKFLSQDGNMSTVSCFGSSGCYIGDFDINSWLDMGPMIICHNIIVAELSQSEGYAAMGECFIDDEYQLCSDEIVYVNENPLRAAAIVFLIMNGVNPE